MPFLTTREMFILKLSQWPALARRYIAANKAGRQALLASTIDRAPLPAVTAAQAFVTPRDIGSIEWFASPDDICRAFAGLRQLAAQPRLAPLGSILSANNDGIGLDPAQWPTVWFKGGSEPGVATVGYLATNSKGQTFVVVAMLSDPAAAPPPLTPTGLLAIVACHEHGTTFPGFLPRAWDHLVASDGTTRRVGLGVLITSGTRCLQADRLGGSGDGVPGGCRD